MDLCSHFSQHQRGCNGSDEPRMDDSLFGHFRKHYDDHLRAIKQSCLQCLNMIESEWKTAIKIFEKLTMSAKQRLLEPLQWIKHCQKEAIGLASFAQKKLPYHLCVLVFRGCKGNIINSTGTTILATFGSLKAKHRTKDLLSAISQ